NESSGRLIMTAAEGNTPHIGVPVTNRGTIETTSAVFGDTLTNNGTFTIKPDTDADSPTQVHTLELGTGSTLRITVGRSDAGPVLAGTLSLSSENPLALAGTLELVGAEGYAPVDGDNVQFLSPVTGKFAAVTTTMAGSWQANYAGGTVSVANGKPPIRNTVLPKIGSATPTVGVKLSAAPGSWSVGAPSFTYQWFRNGTAISGATVGTYTPVAADVSTKLSVRVTAKQDGSKEAAASSVAYTVAAGSLGSPPKPTVSGQAVVAQTLTAKPGTWMAGTKLTYQWLRDGTAISKANASTYTLTAADAGKKLAVKVTGTLAGYTGASTTSTPTKAVAVATLTRGTPTMSGSVVVGQTVTAKPGTWTAGTKLTYQWLRDGTAISKATASTFTLTAADVGKKLAVKVTGTLAGYTTVTLSSVPKSVAMGTLTAAQPTFSGTVAVGSTVTAKTGTWKPTPMTFRYQWLRDGKAISGATGSTYKLVTTDAGKKLTVLLTGSKAGYTSVTKTSAAMSVPLLALTKTPSPTISGTGKVGSTLSAKPGTWAPSTVNLTYQWLRDGKSISGATKSAYKLVAADAGKKVTVKVTGSKTGYKAIAKTSMPTRAVTK
ncbi:hypothetical protein K2F54_10665, partial [Cryobacterium sp. 1639]|nr:hypothetical protein [Cryobacterium sp. 1639]